MSRTSGPSRKSAASQNSQSAKPGPGLWASRVNFARMEFSEIRPPLEMGSAYSAISSRSTN